MRSPPSYALCLLLLAPALACSSNNRPMRTATDGTQAADGQGRTAVPQAAPAAAQPAANAELPGPAAAQAAAVTPQEYAEAEHFYAQRCSLCHGPEGRGNGVAAANLRPKPRSFWEPGWQAGAKDDDIALIIVRGGSAVGRSMMMPASTDLATEPKKVRALVAVVRSFQPKT